jgi:hypothetical protein
VLCCFSGDTLLPFFVAVEPFWPLAWSLPLELIGALIFWTLVLEEYDNGVWARDRFAPAGIELVIAK